MYKQEKRARIRERVQMLYLYKSGIATERQELSKILGRSKPTLTRWMQKYKAGGLKGMLEMKASGHRPSVIPKEALREVKMRLDSEKGFESYKEVQMFLKQEWNLAIPYPTVYFVVRYKLGGSLKTVRPVSDKQDIGAKNRFKKNSINV